MQAFKYFLFLNNFFKKPDSRALIDDLILTLLHRPRYYKLSPPCTLCLKLPVLFGLDVFAIQPNFITRGIAPRLDAFIVGPFLKFLGIIEVFIANNHQLS